MPKHAEAVGDELHVPWYTGSSDPGAVGVGKAWIDQTTPSAPVLKVRNATDDGWITVAEPPLTTPVTHENGGLEADVSTFDGLLRIAGGATTHLKMYIGNTNFDSGLGATEGYAAGSLYLEQDAQKAYICLDPTNGAEVWKEITFDSSSSDPGVITGTAGEALSQGNAVFLSSSDGKWYRIDWGTNAVGPQRGVVADASISTDATGNIRVYGEMSYGSGWSPGQDLYAPVVPGSITTFASAGYYPEARMAYTLTSTTIFVDPQPVKFMTRDQTLADNGTLTLEHYSDPVGRQRKVYAYLSGTVAGSSVESYAETNQDVDVALRRTLRDNLQAWWSLDEASGSRSDAHGSNTLADNNTVGSGTGVVSNAASFVAANSEFLSIADNTSLSMGDIDFTLAAWVNLDSKTTRQTLVGKWDGPSDQREYILEYDSTTDRFRFLVEADGIGGGEGTATANTLGSPSTGTWYFVVAYHSATSNLIGISVNNGTFDTTAYSAGVLDGTSAFALGTINVSSPLFPLDGDLDEVAVWKRILTSAEVTWLYNSGAGRTYAETEKDTLAQSFQISATDDIKTVRLWMKKVGSPTGTLTLRVETDSAGDPSSTLVDVNATTTVAASTLSTSYGWIDFTFATAFSLSASTTYHLVLATSDTASASDYVVWGADASSPGYANGEMKYESAASWAAESKDACFDIIGAATTFDAPLMLCSWNSDVGEAEIVYGDATLADGNTKTTLRNRKNATIDVTLVVELD